MISIKTPEEIQIMAEGGKILAGIMKELEKKVKPGINHRIRQARREPDFKIRRKMFF